MAINRKDIEGFLDRAWDDMCSWLADALGEKAVLRKLATVSPSSEGTVAIDLHKEDQVGAVATALVFRRVVQPVWRLSVKDNNVKKETLEAHDLGKTEPLKKVISELAAAFAKAEDESLLNGVDGRQGALTRVSSGSPTTNALTLRRIEAAIEQLEIHNAEGPYSLLVQNMKQVCSDDSEKIEKALGGGIEECQALTEPLVMTKPLTGVRLHVVRAPRLVVLSIGDAKAVLAVEETMSYDLDDDIAVVRVPLKK